MMHLMSYFNELLSLFFRFVNSSIVLGLGFYAYKKYLAPQLIEAYQQERNEIEHTQNTMAMLMRTQEKEVEALQQDQHRFQQLRKKIDQWHASCAQMQQQATVDREKRMTQINQVRMQQREQLAYAQLLKKTGPEIIERVRQDLAVIAADPQQAHTVINHIMHSMQR